MQRHTHNTRLTPEKKKHGGLRLGAGRPRDKENIDPNIIDSASTAREHRQVDEKLCIPYQQQLEELANPKGRSWTYDECALLLTLITGMIVQSGQTPTEVLHTVSTLVRRSYRCLHALWKMWRDEGEVYVVDTDGRGAGSSRHVYHTRQVTVDIVITLIDYIRNTSNTGTGCTTTGIQEHVLTQHGVTIHARTMRNDLSCMGYRYGKVNVIGKMNDSWYVARIRTFLIQYNKALIEEQQGLCVIVYTDESYISTSHTRR
ncbi:MAG: hypothetical protein ACREHG_00220, partial [Candidatus Saccharimonadales bacterium]